MRLDLHLTKKYPQFSRAHLQKLIKSGAVLVNQKKATPHYQLKSDDKITENITPPEKINLKPDKSIKLDIIYENKNYLVINKPPGLVVHPSESVKSKTLVNALISYYPPIKTVGDKKKSTVNLPAGRQGCQLSIVNNRPGIVHRLDKDVSGLMVIAKTQPAFDDLKRQFKNHQIKKQYTCLVHGNIKKDSGEITTPISRSSKGYKMAVVLGSGRAFGELESHRKSARPAKPAITKFKVIKKIDKYTLLKIQTLTGRTHQIRVHLSSIGHPIIGDTIYQNKKTKTQTQTPRIFLHADYLEFKNLAGKIKKFKLDLPKKLQNLLLPSEARDPGRNRGNIITLSGSIGSGKSTVAKILAKKLGLKHYSSGDFMREMAKEKKLSLIQLSQLAETDKSIDKEIDARQIKLGQEKDNFIIDARLAFHFIPNSIKIFLNADIKERAKRLLKDAIREDHDTDLQTSTQLIKKREKSEKKRYKEYYNLDPYDKKHYDLVINTTNIPAKKVAEKIIEHLKQLT